MATIGYESDWEFNMALTDAFNRETDGHTIFAPACANSFSWNLPFSIATLADTPFDEVAFPTFLVNYEFPNQDRGGLEDYFENVGVYVRPYDGSRLLEINGVEASTFLVNLATESSIFNGLLGAYKTVNPRYMRLMSRYSGDTIAGLYTQEIGSFGQRGFYPGANSVTVTLQTLQGAVETVTIPWAATFLGNGTTTASFISETCPVEEASVGRRTFNRRSETAQIKQHRRAVVAPEAQISVRQAAGASARLADNLVQPNCLAPFLFLLGHIDYFHKDLYPGFPAVYRDSDLITRQAIIAAASDDIQSQYLYSNFRDLNYELFTNDSLFDPPVPQVVNGVSDVFSKHFFDDFGNSSAALTDFDTPPFQAEDYVFVSNGICESTCSIFSSYLFQKHGAQRLPILISELELAGLQDDPAAPQPFPISATFSVNFRNTFSYINKQDGILEYVWEQGTNKYQFTHDQFNKPQKIWEFVAEEFFGH
ncbi:hypothetical protein K438DRAFT_2011416 [Mycena galopus ATCC 62051]|nr:hypothetical protein K438DRAFT_2011416 [Mycena galopus ATCC 62051]